MRSNMFFSFEGIDGSGKTTQARLLAAALRKRGHHVVEVREPGGTTLGESVRGIVLDPSQTIGPRAELLLFSAARAQLVTEVIRPALDGGSIVIADRYVDSSTAYQGGGRGLADLNWMTSLHSFVTGTTEPARTYLIDLDVLTAQSRRGKTRPDRIEKGDQSFYLAVRAAYLKTASLFPERLRVIDGSQTIETQHVEILRDVDYLL